MRAHTDILAGRLLRAMTDMIGAGGPEPAAPAAVPTEPPRLVIEALSTHDWASATFNGALYRLDLRLEGPAVAVIAALTLLQRDLPTRDIPLPGHFVAEIALTPGDPSHGLDAITVLPFCVNALLLDD